MNLTNNALIGFLSVMCAVFALHLILKMEQTKKRQKEQTEREIKSLTDLKAELENNLALCNSAATSESGQVDHFKTDRWREYGGDFPLSDGELEQIQKTYKFFEAMNKEGLASGHFPNPTIETEKQGVQDAIHIVNEALNDLIEEGKS